MRKTIVSDGDPAFHKMHKHLGQMEQASFFHQHLMEKRTSINDLFN
jgi:hypothetical protein